MITSGLMVVQSDGLHDDGWCWPTIKLRARAVDHGSEIRLGVWVKPESGMERAVFTVSSNVGGSRSEFVTFGQPTEISIPAKLSPGDEIDLRVDTSHRASRGEDARDLSFVMTGCVLM